MTIALEQKETLVSDDPDEQAVIITLDGRELPDEIYEQYGITELEGLLETALEGSDIGEFDGNETGCTNVKLYLYGPNGEALFLAIEPILRAHPLCRNSTVVIRTGAPGAGTTGILLPASE